MSRHKRNWHPAGWFRVHICGNNRELILKTTQEMLAMFLEIDEARKS
ncbi:hypothetical protein [Paenisporosarcina sp.]